MINFTFIRYLDAYDLLCSMRSRVGLFTGKENRRLTLRGPKPDADPDDAAAYVPARAATKWPELKTMLRQIEQIGETIAHGPVELGRVYLDWLDPGAIVGWRRMSGPYYAHFWRLHLPLRTNPGAMMYSGVEAIQALPFQLTQVNVLAPHSAINLGNEPRVHLVIDMRKAEPAAIDDAFDKLEAHVRGGGTVVIPTDGMGTGLAELPERAPTLRRKAPAPLPRGVRFQVQQPHRARYR